MIFQCETISTWIISILFYIYCALHIYILYLTKINLYLLSIHHIYAYPMILIGKNDFFLNIYSLIVWFELIFAHFWAIIFFFMSIHWMLYLICFWMLLINRLVWTFTVFLYLILFYTCISYTYMLDFIE